MVFIKNKLFNKFNSLKIGTKIIVGYLVISIVSISFSTFIYQKLNERILTKKVSDMAIQNLETINSNLDLLVYTVDNESKILLSDDNLQHVLRNGTSEFSYNYENLLHKSLVEFIHTNIFISSIYIFDNYGNRYYADSYSFKTFGFGSVINKSWYSDLKKAEGGYILKLNGGGLFKENGRNYISLMRVVNDLDTQKPIGMMIINIPEEAIINSFKNNTTNQNTTFLLKDENDEDIIHSKNSEKYHVFNNIDRELKRKHYYSIEKIADKNYINSYLKTDLNWKIISIQPFNELSNQSNIYKLAILVMLILNTILSFLGLTMSSLYITKPIGKLIKAMNGTEKGLFKRVDIETGDDEIGKLKNVYNTMITKIENLIQQILNEQKIKRKAELDVLQAQIKPHFLYNSFDTISSLALDGRDQEVYEIIKALGNFYRTSLSNGNEVTSVGQELNMVKSYLTIQQIRYDNMFSVSMNIDERADDYKILKLVLQPLVENSIYHGIKPTRRKGNILISSSFKEDYVELVVEDDGVGISQEKLEKLINENHGGIGLRTTIERLNIFYNGKSKFIIKSEPGKGTKITINIPISEV